MVVGLQVQRPIGRAINPVLFQWKNEHCVVVIDQQEIPGTSTAFGVIDESDVRTGDHQHSVPIPEDGPIAINGGRVYHAQDSTVVVWNTKRL